MGLDYFITCGLRHTRIYIQFRPRGERLSECIAERGKTQRPIRYSVFRRRPRSPRLTQNSVGLRWPRFPTTMLSFSWINLPNISISGLIKPRSENIVQILCRTPTFVLFPLYPSRPIESESFRPPSWWLSVLHSIYHSVVHNLKTFPCQITATTNVMNHFRTWYALFACSFKYCHLLELCKTCCPLSDIHFAVVCQG